jgi:long-chain fatty acid transport protein
MRRSLAIASAAAAVSVAAGAPLHAQGSMVDQQSACMAARAGAGVALPCDDGSSVWFNPAGMAMSPSAIGLGVALVRAGNTFTYDPGMAPTSDESIEREDATVPVPQAYVNFRASERLAVGVSALAPYGLGLEWDVCPATTPRCSGTNFEGRFTGYDNQLRGFYIQPTVAYQVIPGRLSLGAGLDYVMGKIDVSRRQFGPETVGLGRTEVADVNLQGEGTGWTYHLGGMLQLGEGAYLGARYLGSAEVDLDGDATFDAVKTGNDLVDAVIAAGLPKDQGVGSTLTFPSQVVVGVGARVHPRVNLMGDFQRTHWSSFDVLPVEFETAAPDTLVLGYNDANTFRLAADFQATDALVVRAGFRYNEAATPRATPLLPEGERNYYSLGLGYRVTRALSTDFSFQYINQPPRAGAVLPGGPRAGIYESRGMVFNFTLAYRFGGAAEQP